MRRHVIIFVAAALCSHSGCSLQQMEDTATTDEPMARVASAIKGGSVPWGGMWSIWSPTPDMKVHPYVKGDFIISTWKNIEPSPNRFSFSALDGRIKAAVDKGLWVGIKIY